MPTTLREILIAWRELDRELDRLVTDGERAAAIRAQIAALRRLYGQVSDAAADSNAAIGDGQLTLEQARDVLRKRAR